PNRARKEYQLALKQAEEASRRRPDDLEILNTRGVARYRIGDYAGSLSDMTRCAAPTFPSGWPKDPNAVVFLAMSQHRLGRLAEAKESFSRVKKLMNNPQ